MMSDSTARLVAIKQFLQREFDNAKDIDAIDKAITALPTVDPLQAQVKELERKVLWLESNWVNPTGE